MASAATRLAKQTKQVKANHQSSNKNHKKHADPADYVIAVKHDLMNDRYEKYTGNGNGWIRTTKAEIETLLASGMHILWNPAVKRTRYNPI